MISAGDLPIYLLRPCSHRQTPEIKQPIPLALLPPLVVAVAPLEVLAPFRPPA